MIYVIIVIIIAGVFEFRDFSKKGLKKEIIIWISFAIITIAFTVYYFNNMNEVSLVTIIMDMFNIEY